MRLEFDITLTAKDMFRFNLYQTYTGASAVSYTHLDVYKRQDVYF